MSVVPFRDPRNGGICTNIRTRRESASETEVAPTARIEGFNRSVDASPGITSSCKALRSQETEDLGNTKAFGETNEECGADAAAAPNFKSRPPPDVDGVGEVGKVGEATPKQRGCLPHDGCVAKDTGVISQPSEPRADRDRAAIPRERRFDRTRKGSATELLPSECTFDSPPTAAHGDDNDNPRNRRNRETRGNGKLRGQPCVSRLRAPGWGRDAAINPIPPASSSAAAVKVNVSLPATPSVARVPASAMFLPKDLLTPVTEVATVDEQSVASCSTRRTARNTPASSVASGHQANHAAPGAGMRGRFHSPSPCGDHRQRGGSGANRLELPARPSDEDRRYQQGVKKGGGWGTGSVGSAQSAPGEGTKRAPGYELASGVRSLSSHRPPLCATDDGVDGRLTSLSSGRTRRGSGGQAGGGYIAAMSRRARSMASCEAARRLAAVARATDKARPSTPISERARWGKGRETQAEVERRKLLQRRSEYADQLQRKAKVSTDDACYGIERVAF